MSIDLGDIPVGTPPTTEQKTQIRTILDVPSNTEFDLTISSLQSKTPCAYGDIANYFPNEFCKANGFAIYPGRLGSVVELDVSNHLASGILVLDALDISVLNCSGNYLSYLSAKEHENLQTVYCNNNQLKDLDLSLCPGIQYLNASYNDLDGPGIARIINDLDFYNVNNGDLIINENPRGLDSPNWWSEVGALDAYNSLLAKSWNVVIDGPL